MYLADFPKQLPSEFFVVALAPTHIPAAPGDLSQFATRFERRLRGIEVARVQPKGRLYS